MLNQTAKKMIMNTSALFLGLSLLAGCSSGTAVTSAGSGAQSGSQTAGTDKLAQIKEAGVIVMATSPDYPPNEFYILDDKGQKQIAGSDIALAKAIAEHLGVKLEIKATDFSGVLANVQAAQVDMALAGLNYTEERAKALQLSNGFFNESIEGYQTLMMKKDTAAKYASIDEIKAAKMSLGAQSGSVQLELAYTLTDPTRIKMMGELPALALALNAGDIDAVVVSTNQAQNMLSSFPDFTILPKETFNLDPENKFSQNVIGFPLGEGYQSLIVEVNQVIDKAASDGSFEKWRVEAIELSKKALE